MERCGLEEEGLIGRITGKGSSSNSGLCWEEPSGRWPLCEDVSGGSLWDARGGTGVGITAPQGLLLEPPNSLGLDLGISCHTDRGRAPLPLGWTRTEGPH